MLSPYELFLLHVEAAEQERTILVEGPVVEAYFVALCNYLVTATCIDKKTIMEINIENRDLR